MSPRRARRPCSATECGNWAVDRGLCAGHARAREDDRGSASDRGYGARWRAIRERFLAENPWCLDCGRAAEVADHAPISRRELVAAGDPDPDDPSHLEPRCTSCHNSRTGRLRR